jgi:rhomboid protease GluP
MTLEPQEHNYEQPSEQPPIQDRAIPPRPRSKFILRAKKPYVTNTILVVTILVFVLQYISTYLFNIDYPMAFGAKINSAITAGQYWRLLTPVFVHGNLMHIAFNMYALYIIGRGIELYYGHLEYTLLYFLSGIGGTLFSYYLSQNASVGASGAIFGLIAADAILLYKNKEILGPGAKKMLERSVMVIVINLLIGLSPGIDNWGHVGGMMIGIIFAWFAGPMVSIDRTENDILIQLNSNRTTSIRVALIILTGIIGLVIFKVSLN